MYSQLGNITFDGRKTPSVFSGTFETNIAEHPLIENRPTIQRVGEKLRTYNLTMLFDQSFCNPSQEIASLDSSRTLGEIMPLVMGDGRYLGDYVIKKVSVNETWNAPNGAVLQAEVQVELLEFFDPDRETTQAISAISQGFAMLTNEPPAFEPVVVVIIPESEAMQGVVDANAAATTSATLLDKIGAATDKYRQKADTIVQKMLKTGDELSEVLTIIDSDPSSEMYARTRDLSSSIGIMLVLVPDVVSECLALISDIDNNNTASIPGRIVTLTDRATEVRARAKQIMDNAASLTSLTATL